MFDTKKQIRAFNCLMSAAVFWIGQENSNCAASVLTMTEQLPINTIEKSRFNRIVSIYNMVFSDTSYENMKSALPQAIIPEKYTIDTETMYAYAVLTAIMNFVSAELYSEAASILLAMSSDWRELYSKAVSSISNLENGEAFCRWCASLSIIAMDIKKTNFLDYGTLAAMFDENGFSDVDANQTESE